MNRDATITLLESYSRLGLSESATIEEVKSSYRQLALRKHPDKNPNNPDATQEFQELSEAYDRLVKHHENPNGFDDEGIPLFFFNGKNGFFPFGSNPFFDEREDGEDYESNSDDEDDSDDGPFFGGDGPFSFNLEDFLNQAAGRGRHRRQPPQESDEQRRERLRRELAQRQEQAQRRRKEEEARKEREREQREEEKRLGEERRKGKKAAKKARQAAAQAEAAEGSSKLLRQRQTKRSAAFQAARKGDRAAVKKAVWEDGVDHSGGEIIRGMEEELKGTVKDVDETLLHLAVEAKDVELVEWLINQGAAPEERDTEGLTAFHRALRLAILPIVDFFIKTFNPYDQSSTAVLRAPRTTTALQLAVSSGDAQAVFKVLDKDLAGVKEITQCWNWIEEQKNAASEKWEKVKRVLAARNGFTPPTPLKQMEEEKPKPPKLTQPSVPSTAYFFAQARPAPAASKATFGVPPSPPKTAQNTPDTRSAKSPSPPMPANTLPSQTRVSGPYPTPPTTANGNQEPTAAPTPSAPSQGAPPTSGRAKKKAKKAQAQAQMLAEAQELAKAEGLELAEAFARVQAQVQAQAQPPAATKVEVEVESQKAPVPATAPNKETVPVSQKNSSRPVPVAQNPRAGRPPPPPNVVNQIVEMGFTPQQARAALAATSTGDDVEAAIEALLQSPPDSGSVPAPAAEARATTAAPAPTVNTMHIPPPVHIEDFVPATPESIDSPTQRMAELEKQSEAERQSVEPQLETPRLGSEAAFSGSTPTQLDTAHLQDPTIRSSFSAQSSLPAFPAAHVPWPQRQQGPAQEQAVPITRPVFKVNIPRAKLATPEPTEPRPQVRLPTASAVPAPPPPQGDNFQQYQHQHQPQQQYPPRGRGRGWRGGYRGGRGRGFYRGRGPSNGPESSFHA